MQVFMFEGHGFFNPVTTTSVFMCNADSEEEAKELLKTEATNFAEKFYKGDGSKEAIEHWLNTFSAVYLEKGELVHFDPKVPVSI